ncbi:hypothetical protein ILYODFUR_028480 [Ilyodon furcidens]|uniref:Uncharacterized protein n=1 Tax=Ilyodon furcidens TaxID=33524 RepID=A0ABV0T4A1_9TELE
MSGEDTLTGLLTEFTVKACVSQLGTVCCSARLIILLNSLGLHGGTVALQQEGPGFNSQPVVFLHGVCMFSPCMCETS